MEEAKAQIMAIVDPPKAELGKTYSGRVVNITKFGAFVNILPGRDGLVHISKLGGGKRIAQVEDVLSLGDVIEVRVDEIDDKGKVSLVPTSPVGGGEAAKSSEKPEASDDKAAAADGDGSAADAGSDGSATPEVIPVSFEESFDEQLRAEVGDLGPDTSKERPAGSGSRSGRRRRRHR